MSISSILIISLAAAVVLVVGGGLMIYMGNLVRSAYEIKVQITTDVDERLSKIAEDLDKKSRWIKRDVLEEVEKIRVAMTNENAEKFHEFAEPLVARLDEIGELLKNERNEWVKAVESDRQNITALDTRVKALRRDVKRLQDKVGLESGAALDDAAAPAPAAPAPAGGAAPAAPPPPSTAPQSMVLQDLTQG